MVRGSRRAVGGTTIVIDPTTGQPVVSPTCPVPLKGDQGIQGSPGRGIDMVEASGSTLTITFTDGTSQEVDMPPGSAGASVVSFERDPSDQGFKITLSDGNSFTAYIPGNVIAGLYFDGANLAYQNVAGEDTGSIPLPVPVKEFSYDSDSGEFVMKLSDDSELRLPLAFATLSGSGAKSVQNRGGGNATDGSGSFAFGDSNTVIGDNSGAFGDNNNVKGNSSLAIGSSIVIKSGEDFLTAVSRLAIGRDFSRINSGTPTSSTDFSLSFPGEIWFDPDYMYFRPINPALPLRRIPLQAF